MTGCTRALVLALVFAAIGLGLPALRQPTAALGEPVAGLPTPDLTAEVDRADLDALFAQMDRNGKDVTSGHLVVRTRRTSHAAGRWLDADEVEEEIWFDGVRVRIEERETAFQPRPRSTTAVYDGALLTTIVTEPSGRAWYTVYDSLTAEEALGHTSVGISDMLMYWPLSPSVWGSPPRGSAFAARRVRLPRLVGEEQIEGIDCMRLVLLPKERDPETIAYESLWVAPERGHAIARFERHTLCRSERSNYAYGETWQAQKWLHPTNGLWLPAATVNRRYEQDLDILGESRLHERRAEIVTSEFNVSVPDEVFRVEVPATAQLVPPGRQRGRGG